MPDRSLKQLVILGAGFGGFRLAQEIDYRRYNVTLVSPRNYFLFTPLLMGSAVGTVEFRSVIEPVRRLVPPLHFVEASCVGVDLSSREVRCQQAGAAAEFRLPFDELVIAVGATTNTFSLPGVVEHSLFLKDVSDARKVRQRFIQLLEQASAPNITPEERKKLLYCVVVGGGPTGVELAGELRDLADHEVREHFGAVAQDIRVVLIEAQDEILSSFDKRLRDYTLYRFRKRNIEVRTDTMVREVTADRVILKDGESIFSGMTIWAAGITTPPLIRALPFEKDRAGRLSTNGLLNVAGQSSIYAIGDCAAIVDKNFPTTAQRAEQQARYLAKALNAHARGKSVREFSFRDLGMLAYLGEHQAIADLPGVKGYGFFAWLFWRAVYLTKIVSLRNRILLLFDWLKAALFGRDLSKF